MTEETLTKAEFLRDSIKNIESDLKDIKRYESNIFLKRRNLKICIPYTSDGITSDITIADTQLKKDILNLIKIHLIRTVQEAKKELESL